MVFALLLLQNRPRLDCRVSGLVVLDAVEMALFLPFHGVTWVRVKVSSPTWSLLNAGYRICASVCVCVCAVFIQYGVPACLLSCSNVAWRACVVIFSSEQRVSCQRTIVTLLFVRFFTRLLRMITPFDVAEIWLVFDSLFWPKIDWLIPLWFTNLSDDPVIRVIVAGFLQIAFSFVMLMLGKTFSYQGKK